MDATLIAAIAGAIGTVLGAASAFVVGLRKSKSEARLLDAQADKAQTEANIADAQADKTQAEANRLLLENLTAEIERLKNKISELETRLTKSEARAAGAESRLADSETRAAEFRRAVIVIGERLDRERAKYREMATNLVGIIEKLLDCIEHPEKVKDIDRPAIEHLIQGILDNYPSERFIEI